MINLLPERIEQRIHNHGLVALTDIMPRLVPEGQTADHAIVQAARVSYGQGTKSVSEDRALLRMLMRDRHTSPFEMVETKWYVKCPMFIARQWMRHRTASVNEVSGRYSQVKEEFWVPKFEDIRGQGTLNKQVGDGSIDDNEAIEFKQSLIEKTSAASQSYQYHLEKGVCREQARGLLPLSVYTEFVWKIDLHNLLHFLQLRMAPDAQQEIRDYAHAMYAMLKPIVPWTCEAFEDYRLQAMTLSRLEVEALRDGKALESESKREKNAFAEKMKRLEKSN